MNRQINHKVMRVVVGLIALLLAPTVYLLANTEYDLKSISISYWTDSHDIFVGALIAVGFFLSAYNGTGDGKDWEYYLSKAACVFAICVALFPTTDFNGLENPAHWISVITNSVNMESSVIHRLSSILFFACLIALMWFFSNRAKNKGKTGRSYFYRTISISMAAGIIALSIYGNFAKINNVTLFIEVWGLTLFGIGWLVAGSYKTETFQQNNEATPAE